MKLENWSVVTKDSNPYLAPEARRPALHGKVYGHPRFMDGEEVTTSTIVKAENGIVETRAGSKYELGKIDPNYAAIYPNAYQQLFKQEN